MTLRPNYMIQAIIGQEIIEAGGMKGAAGTVDEALDAIFLGLGPMVGISI
ncbi:hypothetical protein [Parasphingorhabdus sp.]